MTVLEFPLNVPSPSQLPFTVSVFVPRIVSVAPVSMEIFRHTALEPISGEYGTPGRMTTSVVLPGTDPPHQFVPSDQTELVVPIHLPGRHCPTYNAPGLAAK